MTDNFIEDFIKEYQKQPCLWQGSCVDFKNRRKRQEAYLKLIDVATKHGETYNIERTKQKINNLRCAFRVQLKKYMDFQNNSKGKKEESYCPKRKYMDNLMFLINEEKPVSRRRKSSTNESDDCQLLSKQRKQIDRELNAITMSLESETEDNVEQKIDIIDEESLTNLKTNCNLNTDSKETSEKHIILNLNRSDEILTKSDDNIYQNRNDENEMIDAQSDNEVNIFWTRPVISNPVNEVKVTRNEELKKLPVQTQIVHVRTVKQPTIKKTAPIVSTPTTKKIVVTQQTTPISSLQKSQKLSTLKTMPTQTECNDQTFSSLALNKPSTTQIVDNNVVKIKEDLISSSITTNKNKIHCNATNFEKLLSLACSRINQIADAEDDFGVFGRLVTCKLRGMDADQAFIAQKQITSILFDGHMKLLQLSSQEGNSTIKSHQQLHSTTIRPIRNSTGERTYFISGLNGNNSTSFNDQETVAQYNTISIENDKQILGK